MLKNHFLTFHDVKKCYKNPIGNDYFFNRFFVKILIYFFLVSQTYQFNIIFKLILNMFYFIPPALFLSSTCSLAILHLLSSYSPSAAFLFPPALFPARLLHSYPPNSYLPTCSLLTPAPFPHLLSSQSRP